MLNKFFLILLLFVSACTNQTQFTPAYPPLKIHSQELQFPEWFVNFPQYDNLSIGLSYKTNDDTMLKEARESAAIFYSRNRASINIKKYAANYDAHAAFELIVSSEPEQLRKIADSLQLVDFFYLNHYFIGLFSLDNKKYEINHQMVSNQTLFQPYWFEGNHITLTHGTVYSKASSSSSDLKYAWKVATEKALLQIADYITKKVHSKQIMIDDNDYKFVSVETAMVLDDIKTQHIFVSSQIKDSLPSYTVFICLTIQ